MTVPWPAWVTVSAASRSTCVCGADRTSVQMPPRPPVAAILVPKSNDVVYAERRLHLWGTAASAYPAEIPDERFVWSFDGTQVGRGRDLWVGSPAPGRHRVRLEVSDEGGTGAADSEPELLQPEPPDGDQLRARRARHSSRSPTAGGCASASRVARYEGLSRSLPEAVPRLRSSHAPIGMRIAVQSHCQLSPRKFDRR